MKNKKKLLYQGMKENKGKHSTERERKREKPFTSAQYFFIVRKWNKLKEK